MSGSPVIRRVSGAIPMKGGGIDIGPGSATDFLGVYSGRVVSEGSLDAQLGVVWKARVIGEIIKGKRAEGE